MDHINEDDKCLAAGLDMKGNPVSIFLTPIIADCGLTNRCFRRETNLQHCKVLIFLYIKMNTSH